MTLRAVLFDLDGTLADTAPDLGFAANALRRARGLDPLPHAVLRPVASHGARGLLKVALDIAPLDPGYEALRLEFLEHYESRLWVDSIVFDGVPEVLAALAARGIAWGIVTNKASRFTTPIVKALALRPAPQVVVAGDTTAFSKPHPEPLLHAAAALLIAPAHCVYVGDDLRDIQAGRAAGMYTVAAAYGYCGDGDPRSWGADRLIDAPTDLLAIIDAL